MSRRTRLGAFGLILPVLSVLLPHPSSATPVTAVSFEGSGYEELYDVTGLPDGSMVAVGVFDGSMIVGDEVLTSTGSRDVLVLRLATDGSVAWAVRAGGSGLADASGVTALPDGSAVVSGHFSGTATFGDTVLTSAGLTDVFIARIGPDGDWQWAISGGGSSYEFASRIATAADGSVLVIGSFYGTAVFGGQSLTSAGATDVFLLRVAADGTWRSATRVGGALDDFPGDLVAGSNGSAIVVGSFTGTADFGGGPIGLTSTGSRDAFVAKVALVAGNLEWQWATRAGGSGSDSARGVAAIGSDGTTVVAGEFTGSATFGALSPVTSVGGRDVFAARVRPDGTWDWVASGGGAADEDLTGIVARSDGSAVVVGGLRNGSAVFGTEPLSTTNLYDVFAATITSTGIWSSAVSSADPSTVFPYGVVALPDEAVGIVGGFEGSATFGATTLTTSGPGDGDVFLTRLGSTGAWLEWARTAVVPAAPTRPAAPVQTAGPTLDCAVDGTAETRRMTCTVRDAVPDVAILWRATYNPVLASDGFTPGAEGSGIFSFPLPAVAAGSVVSIELVDWLAPLSVSVPSIDAVPSSSQGGPVPVRVPAGDGGATMPSMPLLLLLVGVGAFLAGRARGSSIAPASS